MKPTHLRCEYLAEPLAIDNLSPRLSWELESSPGPAAAQRQTAYQILVRNEKGGVCWDSGKVRSDETLHIRYAGEALEMGQRYTWRVRVWDATPAGRARAGVWSAPASWSMGLWGPGWSRDAGWDAPPILAAAQWIASPLAEAWSETQSPPALMLRKAFALPGKVRRAIVYASALGVYDLSLNGARVGDQVLAPEWTDYRQMCQYQAYDVTDQLRDGDNVLAAQVGAGWYAGRIGMSDMFANLRQGIYGRRLALIAMLRATLADGKVIHIATDGSWRGSTQGPIRSADFLDGETHDARCAFPGWDAPAPGVDDSKWFPAAVLRGPRLAAQINEPIRITRRLRPIAVTEPAPGVFIIDMGQNMVGWVRLSLRGQAGTTVRLRHGEALNADGTLYRDNLRGAAQEDRYICRGEDVETFEPRFTYHGFRYVEVTGLGDAPALDDVVGCVFHSASPDVGTFECSSPLLNRIMSAVQWTQRSNMHSTPTDCPQRDERLGWMGDAQVFSQSAIFNMDMAAFFTKWALDIRQAQTSDGRFPDFAPHAFDPGQRFSGNPGWGDAGVIVPWRVYVNYADRSILAEQFDAARRYVDWSAYRNPDLVWRNGSQLAPLWYGDWLNGDTFKDLPGYPTQGGQVPKEVFATAYFALSAELVSRMARVLGRTREAAHYARLAQRVRTAFRAAFVARDGKILGDTQAGYALALHFDLLTAAQRRQAVRHLLRSLQAYGGGLSTGIHSTVCMMKELTRAGEHDAAFALMNRTSMPSWGYMVEHGGTTIWERWDGWVEGRGFQNPGMNSFNHYAMGAVGEWMWRVIVGINPDEEKPGYKHFHVRPIPGGGLTWARGEYRSVRGPIRVEWRLSNGSFNLELDVPCNTTATVHLPDAPQTIKRVGPGSHTLNVPV